MLPVIELNSDKGVIQLASSVPCFYNYRSRIYQHFARLIFKFKLDSFFKMEHFVFCLPVPKV